MKKSNAQAMRRAEAARAEICEDKIPTRADMMERMKEVGEYDVLVVGGGATGCGVALDAAMRGLKVCCVEGEDFA